MPILEFLQEGNRVILSQCNFYILVYDICVHITEIKYCQLLPEKLIGSGNTGNIFFKKISTSYKQYLHVVEVAFSVTYWHQKKNKKKTKRTVTIYASKVIIRLIHNI
jgi:hypothetical protein